MRDGWEDVQLGDLVNRRRDFTSVDREAKYTILGVQRSGWGFVDREPITGSHMKFTKLMRLACDDLVYRTITAFEAPSAVAGPAQAERFVTPQAFPVYRINADRLLPAYMRILTTCSSFHQEMASRCTGTVIRRKTLSQAAFEAIPVALPPLAEQRRIIDLLDSVDSVTDLSRAVSGTSAAGLLSVLRSNLVLSLTSGEHEIPQSYDDLMEE